MSLVLAVTSHNPVLHEWSFSLAFYRGQLTFVTNSSLCPTAGALERAAVILSFHWSLKMNCSCDSQRSCKKGLFFFFHSHCSSSWFFSFLPVPHADIDHWSTHLLLFFSPLCMNLQNSPARIWTTSHNSRMFRCPRIKQVLSFKKCLKLALIPGIILTWIIWKYTALGLCTKYCASFASHC